MSTVSPLSTRSQAVHEALILGTSAMPKPSDKGVYPPERHSEGSRRDVDRRPTLQHHREAVLRAQGRCKEGGSRANLVGSLGAANATGYEPPSAASAVVVSSVRRSAPDRPLRPRVEAGGSAPMSPRRLLVVDPKQADSSRTLKWIRGLRDRPAPSGAQAPLQGTAPTSPPESKPESGSRVPRRAPRAGTTSPTSPCLPAVGTGTSTTTLDFHRVTGQRWTWSIAMPASARSRSRVFAWDRRAASLRRW